MIRVGDYKVEYFQCLVYDELESIWKMQVLPLSDIRSFAYESEDSTILLTTPGVYNLTGRLKVQISFVNFRDMFSKFRIGPILKCEKELGKYSVYIGTESSDFNKLNILNENNNLY